MIAITTSNSMSVKPDLRKPPRQRMESTIKLSFNADSHEMRCSRLIYCCNL